MRAHVVLVAMLAAQFAHAQGIKLPEPSRTVFKCTVNGKVVYSDDPCAGAQRIDVEPTRGVSKSAGQERIGHDVRREQHREMFAEAVKPLTGLDAKELDKRTRRMKLPPGVATECAALDRKIAETEAAERTSTRDALPATQKSLLQLRERYRSARC
jgi:hypothetical protein